MSDLITLIFALIVDLFRSRAALEAEVIALRQQILVLRRGRLARLPFLVTDRLVLGWLCWLFPHARDALAVVRPQTVLRWHRAGFQSYWRWKSRRRPGRPAMSAEIRHLIHSMSVANPLWGDRESMANCSNSESMPGRPALPSIWRGGGDRRRRAGRRSCAIMRMVSRRWTCSW